MKIKMKIKIISILLIVMILFQNISFAAVIYSRTDGTDLDEIATILTDNIYLEDDYSASSVPVKFADIKVYNYNTTVEKEMTNTEMYHSDNTDKFYVNNYVTSSGTSDNLRYTIKLKNTDTQLTNVATIVYQNAIEYKGNKYNLKLNIKEIRTEETAQNDPDIKEAVVYLNIGNREHSDDNVLDTSTYTANLDPFVSVYSGSKKVETQFEYCVVDDNLEEKQISGVYGVTDLDVGQGCFIDDFVVSANNTYMKQESEHLKYKNMGDGTYIYSDTEEDTAQDHVYLLIANKSKLDFTLTWSPNHTPGSGLKLLNDAIKTYKTITTEVINGTITQTITRITDGENKSVSYAPNENYYLKSITVDGVALSAEELVTFKDSYTFSNITENHSIKVEYSAKPTVTFNSNGGTIIPTQIVDMDGKAIEPTDPTRPGYVFKEWIGPDEVTTAYNFNTPVTEDITLTATWTPNENRINYVLNAENATNPETNPTKYNTGETITSFAEPTRPGYDFNGWYEDEDLTNEFPGISATDYGDKTLYAKWTPKSEIKYVVEHYLETLDGKYEKDTESTQNLSGYTGETVTAIAKTYTGFKENTTHEDRVYTGTIAEDGSLVLKLYYDRIEYKVTFDTKGGTPKPDDQTKKYGEKVTKPNDPKIEGYTFAGWYYEDEEGTKYDYNFDTPVTNDIKLIAKWNAIPKEDTTIITPKKEDTTTAKTILPNTGKTTIIAIAFGICAVVVFGKKYYNLRDINK